MRPRAVVKELSRLESLLFSLRSREPVLLTSEWAASMPVGGGVYAWFDGRKLVYVGESGCLKKRFGDCCRTRNHTLRRAVGRLRFAGLKGYKPASAKETFPPHIEKRINQYLKTLKVSALEVNFGRTEFEEYLVKKHRPVYNKRMQRGHK